MKIIMSRFLLFLFFIFSGPLYAEEGFTGLWQGEKYGEDKENPESFFQLKLYQYGNHVKGSYCYISEYGNRIDCGVDNEININGSAESDTILYVTFDSPFGGKNGRAKLITDHNKMIWQVVAFPQEGDFVVPEEYSLNKYIPDKSSKVVRKMLVTDSFNVIIYNKCGISEKCDRVSYLGIRQSDGQVMMLEGNAFSADQKKSHVDVYEFRNKNVNYRVYLDEGLLEVRKDGTAIVSQKGRWVIIN